MIKHHDLHLLIVAATEAVPAHIRQMFEAMPHLKIEYAEALPASYAEHHAVITIGQPLESNEMETLLGFVRQGGGWFVLINERQNVLPDAFGVQPGPVGPGAELRVLFQNAEHSFSVRLPDALYATGTIDLCR